MLAVAHANKSQVNMKTEWFHFFSLLPSSNFSQKIVYLLQKHKLTFKNYFTMVKYKCNTKFAIFTILIEQVAGNTLRVLYNHHHYFQIIVNQNRKTVPIKQ
jgi:hypothetical protein